MVHWAKKSLYFCVQSYVWVALFNKLGGVAQSVRALACHARGCEFESRHSRHFLVLLLNEDECIIILWGRTGFDLDSYARLQAEDNGWPLKTSIKNVYANSNIDMAPSLAEADEILARFGWAEEATLAA